MVNLRTTSLFGNLLGVLFFLSIPLFFHSGQFGLSSVAELLTSAEYLLFCGAFIAVYYLHTKALIPLFYLKRKYAWYFLSLFMLLVVIIAVKPFDALINKHQRHFNQEMVKNVPPPPNRNRPAFLPESGERPLPQGEGGRGRTTPFIDMVSVFILVMIILSGILNEMVKQWRISEKRALQAEAEKAHAELSFLKAQINPHFLFNTLNNIYSLAVTQDENTADAIMKLSNLMRYVTDDVHEDSVALEDEVNCIQDYISLQKLRLGKKVDIQVKIEGDLNGYFIPPIVLMTFVENAFKHGISSHEQTDIFFELVAGKKHIHFFAQNKIFENSLNKERQGIGLSNTTERLKLLYPEKHALNITRSNGLFTVELDLYS
ncbi:MAG: sensor histidine kinase [Ferruginibacter sp.]